MLCTKSPMTRFSSRPGVYKAWSAWKNHILSFRGNFLWYKPHFDLPWTSYHFSCCIPFLHRIQFSLDWEIWILNAQRAPRCKSSRERPFFRGLENVLLKAENDTAHSMKDYRNWIYFQNSAFYVILGTLLGHPKCYNQNPGQNS